MGQSISSNPADLLSLLLAAVIAITALLIALTSFTAILRMTAATNHMVRLVYTTAATAAFAQFIGVVCYGMSVTESDALATLIIAVLLALLDRRTNNGPHPNTPAVDRRRVSRG